MLIATSNKQFKNTFIIFIKRGKIKNFPVGTESSFIFRSEIVYRGRIGYDKQKYIGNALATKLRCSIVIDKTLSSVMII